VEASHVALQNTKVVIGGPNMYKHGLEHWTERSSMNHIFDVIDITISTFFGYANGRDDRGGVTRKDHVLT
jgi:hypothetical protein